MEEKKIATSIDVLINVDRFEHIQITKYAEKKITYDNQEEMIQKEDQLTEELVKDILRTMRSMPNKLGKKTSAVATIEDKIGKKMPTWLNEGVVPNIANKAKENAVKIVAEADAKSENKKIKEDAIKTETDDFLEGKYQETAPSKPQNGTKQPKTEDNNLFEDLFK